jgi:hypothetical protein
VLKDRQEFKALQVTLDHKVQWDHKDFKARKA